MFFRFPIRTIVQEEHEGTSLPYNNIQHGMYSLPVGGIRLIKNYV